MQGIFLTWLLWRTKVNQPANKILGTLLLILSFHLVLVAYDEREFFMTFPHLSRISWVIGTLYGPLIFLFVQQLMHARLQSKWIQYVVFVPFIIVLVCLVPYFLQTAEEKRIYLSEFEKSVEDDFGWINQFVSVMHIVLQVGILLFYLRWEKDRSKEFSSLEVIRIKWLRQFIIFSLGVTFFGVAIFFARTWSIPFLSDVYHFHFMGVVLLFYWLSYKALTQPVLFGMVREEFAVTPSHSKASPPEKLNTQLQEVFSHVKQALEEKKLYLKNDLSLTDLAEQTSISKNLVSQAINEIYKGNFFDLVNDYRVEEFKRKAVSPSSSHLSLLGIALESGFSSKASFYAVFKKKTGQTPSVFINSLKKQSE